MQIISGPVSFLGFGSVPRLPANITPASLGDTASEPVASYRVPLFTWKCYHLKENRLPRRTT